MPSIVVIKSQVCLYVCVGPSRGNRGKLVVDMSEASIKTFSHGKSLPTRAHTHPNMWSDANTLVSIRKD